MSRVAELLQLPPFGVPGEEKHAMLLSRLNALTIRHNECCPEYRRILSAAGYKAGKAASAAEIPFLPVSLFKEFVMRSIPQEQVFKVLTSSGTGGQAVSRIELDRESAANQQKTLVRIVSDIIGASRLPMLIADSPSVLSDRTQFSARGAGILGFSLFGADRTYALHDDMTLDTEALHGFLERHGGGRFLLFGFTFMVFQHFCGGLSQLPQKLDLHNGILIHGGGWKKLRTLAISSAEFKKRLADCCGITQVHDYYGMAEQTGTVCMECECGHLHCSSYSDILFRRSRDLSICGKGEPGIIQVLSILPESYPGHSLLTEDEGVLLGEDDCPCGRKGKYFQVIGRLKNAEIRGCSDTYAAKF